MSKIKYKLYKRHWNKLFSVPMPRVINDYMPLAIGTHEVLSAIRKDGVTDRQIKRFMLGHCHSTKYLLNILFYDARVNLNGNVVSKIEESHRDFAKYILNARGVKYDG